MSKIWRAQETSDVEVFSFADFTAHVMAEEEGRAKVIEFVPDLELVAGSEFIPGGFDFEYEGGLRRDEIINRTLDEAETILVKAREEANAIKAGAKGEGFESGYNEGYEVGLKEATAVMDSFVALTKELINIRDQYYGKSEEEMIHLVIKVVQAVINVEVDRDTEVIRGIIRKAVANVQNKEYMIIKVNPKDLAEAEKYRPQMGKEFEGIDKVEFKSDPMITRGGCIVETNIGSIDARLEMQLEAMRETFLETLEEGKALKHNGAGA